MRAVFFERASRAIAAVCVLTFLPLGSLPAIAAATHQERPVTRGELIRTAVRTLGIHTEKNYTSEEAIPTSLLPYIGVAAKRGALSIFGSKVDHLKAITRGQAAFVLMKLTGATPTETFVTFTDVASDSPLAAAVQVAVERQWMKATRPTSFGAAQGLKDGEWKLILQRIKKTAMEKKEKLTDTHTIKVNLKPGKDLALPKSDILRIIWQLLNTDYLHKEKLKADDAGYKAAEGLVQSLNDPYTVFMRPALNKSFQTQIQGEVTGIGAQVEQKNGALIIISPLRGSPAEKAGLLPGDEIISADGTSLAGFSFEDAVDKVRGPKGSTVKLVIRRNGAEMNFEVVRDTVKVPEIEINFQGEIAVVKLHQFGDITDHDFRSLMADVQKQNPKGLILDLRNNPGGLLHAADIVVSNFLPVGSVVASIQSTTKQYQETTSDPPTIADNVPIIVLVNKGSASASEITAGALQDAKRARVVGETTFGKGTVQQVLQFTDGSSLKMTVAEWLTPSGRKIDGVGLEPDVKVELGDRDEQMLKALDLLR